VKVVTDLLIRDVPDDVVAALDARAKALGLSRTEFLRRQMARVASGSGATVSVDDLCEFAATFADLADPDIMRGAWE